MNFDFLANSKYTSESMSMSTDSLSQNKRERACVDVHGEVEVELVSESTSVTVQDVAGNSALSALLQSSIDSQQLLTGGLYSIILPRMQRTTLYEYHISDPSESPLALVL